MEISLNELPPPQPPSKWVSPLPPESVVKFIMIFESDPVFLG